MACMILERKEDLLLAWISSGLEAEHSWTLIILSEALVFLTAVCFAFVDSAAKCKGW